MTMNETGAVAEPPITQPPPEPSPSSDTQGQPGEARNSVSLHTARGGNSLAQAHDRRLELRAVAELLRHLSNDVLIPHLGNAIRSLRATQPSAPSPALIRADHPAIALAAAMDRGADRIAAVSEASRVMRTTPVLFEDLFQRFPLNYLRTPPTLAHGTPIAIARFVDAGARDDVEANLQDLVAVCTVIRQTAAYADCPVFVLTNIRGSKEALERESGAAFVCDFDGRSHQVIDALLRETGIRDELYETIRGLARSRDLDAVLKRLDSKNYVRLRHFAEDKLAKDRPISDAALAVFKARVLHGEERFPRHTAAIYLATHFAQISPADFVELANRLVDHTPVWTPPARDARPPAALTDVVLNDCNIRLKAEENEARFDNPEDASVDSEELRAEIKRLFRERAPLLLEQYLLAMSLQMTLGHPSEEVADQYAALEIEALEQNASMRSASAMTERLKRIVFGYAAVTSANEDYFRQNVDRIQRSLELALERTPRLLRTLHERVQSRDGAAAMRTVLAELCSAQPVSAELERWSDPFDEGTVRLFWTMFAQEPEISVADFPALRRHAAPILQSRRTQLLAWLHRVVLDREPAQGLETIREPATMRRLLLDVAASFRDLSPADALPPRLLYIAAVAALPGLREPAEAAQADPERVRDVAKSLFSPETHDWIEAPGLDAAQIDEGGFRFLKERWSAAGAGLDVITGISAYGIDHLRIRSQWLELEAGRVGVLARDFDDTQVWQVECGAEPEVHPQLRDDALQAIGRFRREIIIPLLNAVRIAALMAVTRRDGPEGVRFVIEGPLREWLRGGAVAGGETPARAILEMVEECRELARRWEGYRAEIARFPGLPTRAHQSAAQAFRDRQADLAKFVGALSSVQQGPGQTATGERA